MGDPQQFLDRVRQGLLVLEQTINALRCAPDDGENGLSVEFLSLVEARSVVAYLERVALDSRQFEIAGLCRFVGEGCEEFSASEISPSVQASSFDPLGRYLQMKDLLTPSDIGRLTRPQLNPAITNLLLKELGLVAQAEGGWIATAQGLEHAVQHARRDGRKPYVIWRRSVLTLVQKAVEDGRMEALPNPWANSGRRRDKAQR